MIRRTFFRGCWAAVLGMTVWPVVVAAQQRPLLTEDPETVGEGVVLVEAGFDYLRDQRFTVSGLEGNVWRVPAAGVSIGLSSIAEIQSTVGSIA